jgi:hypothetical protein
MRYFAIAVGVLLAASFPNAATAAETQAAFTGSGATCADITWQPGALARYPNIGLVCQAVVERNGKLYARFNGTVSRRSGNSLYIRFEGGEKVPGGDHALLIKPPEGMLVQTSRGQFRLSDAQRGQQFTVYIPSDHFVLNLGDEIVVANEMPVVEVVPVTEEPAMAEVAPAPAPAEPARVAEAPPPPPVETPAPEVTQPAPPPTIPGPAPQPQEQSPWALIGIVVIVIVVIAVVVMRRRSK